MVHNFWNRLKSYTFGVHVESVDSRINGKLNVYYVYGRYLLNAAQANYSYGELHKGFRKIFKKIKLKDRKFEKVLLLGFGSGSVVSIIQEEMKKNCTFTAVEKDPLVIELGNKYFNIKRFKNLEIIISDAESFVAGCKDIFDLVVFDVYVDLEIPAQFASGKFLVNLKSLVAKNGLLVYNKDLNSEKMVQSAVSVRERFKLVYPGFREIWIGRKNLFFVWENN